MQQSKGESLLGTASILDNQTVEMMTNQLGGSHNMIRNPSNRSAGGAFNDSGE